MNSIQTILIGLCFAIGVSIFFLFMVQFLHPIINVFVIHLGILSTIVILIYIAVNPAPYQINKWIIFGVFLAILITIVLRIFMHRDYFKRSLLGLFFEYAT